MERETIKKIIKKMDQKLGSNFYSRLKRAEDFWNNLAIFDIFRKITGLLKLKFQIKKGKEIKLHLGCGGVKKEGYINIDVKKTPATDLVWNLTKKLPFENNSVDMIECYHLLEHLPVCLMANINPSYGKKYEDIIRLLKEWRRVLKPGGKLVIEAPDFERIIEEYQKAEDEKKEEFLPYIFGGFRNKNIYDIHRWGVGRYRLAYIFQEAGFQKFEFKEAQDYHIKSCPCLRAECIK